MRQAQPATVLPFPQQSRPRDYSDGYRNGLTDGEKWANVHFVWLGVAIGVILSGGLALGVIWLLSR